MRRRTRKNPHSQRYAEAATSFDRNQFYDIDDAISLVKSTATAKNCPESVDLAIRLGVDAKKSDQNVRGITQLPHGTGRTKKVAVLAKGDLASEAEAAGADYVGAEDLIAKITGGFRDFDVVLAAEDMAPQIGKIGKILGPRTPNKRNGTVTNAVGQAVKEIKAATRAEYRIDKAGVVHMGIGKAAFSPEQIKENLYSALNAIIKAKPATSKGRYLVSVTLSSSMGPGVKIDPSVAHKFGS
ncbi:MAG: 50S ribosomal protein L1 [Fimbriimonadaceae bacterium]|nr:MAG: 50S ribosomal protein L1 [Fimbriimonadaceae bacterium]HQU19039.1 50S ribosomal protein L1 [Fimbriimonadaceae bacterium]